MRKEKHKKRLTKKGRTLGEMVYLGEEKNTPISIDFFIYNDQECDKTTGVTAQNLPTPKSTHKLWIDIDGIHDANTIIKIGKKYELHPLTIGDLLDTFTRPKSDEFDTYIYLTVKMLTLAETEGEIKVVDEQISLVLQKNCLLSFQSEHGDVFGPVRERLLENGSRIRTRDLDFLLYSLLDIIVDKYFDILERIHQRSDEIEEKLLSTHDKTLMIEILETKNELIQMRKHVFPIREAILKIIRSDHALIKPESIKYFNSILDNVHHTIEQIEILKDINLSQREILVSNMNLKMNQVMETLTVISGIFIPLTFIVGIYGMNFHNMPELSHPMGYPLVWVVMIVVATGIIMYYKKKKWL